MHNKANEQLVMDFFHAMGPTLQDVLNAYTKYFHPQGVWKNSGFPDMRGIDNIRHLLEEQKRLFDFESVKVLEHRKLASCDDSVFFERRDSIVNSKGEVVYAFDILGVFDIENGKIVEWRDYMDTTQIKQDWAARNNGNMIGSDSVC